MSEVSAWVTALRVGLAVVMVAEGGLLHRRLAFDGRAMRRLGLNGEIELVYRGWQRDALTLLVAGVTMGVVALVRGRGDAVDADAGALLVLSCLGAWIGYQRLRDRTVAHALAAETKRRQANAPGGL